MGSGVLFRRIVSHIRGLPSVGSKAAAKRWLLVANGYIPTLQMWFVDSLKQHYQGGQLFSEILTEQHLEERFGNDLNRAKVGAYVQNVIRELQPEAIIFCRYSGPHVETMLSAASKAGARTIFHVDDDLLNVPLELGETKYAFHNQPARLESVRLLLRKTDLVLSSTRALAARLASYGLRGSIHTAKLSCWGEVLAFPVVQSRGRIKIGYMGIDHGQDLRVALDGLIGVLDRYPNVDFELFGKIPKFQELDRFGPRVIAHPPILSDYEAFLEGFAALRWTIGICPLTDNPFNKLKSINKWVEYTAVGAAVVATGEGIYDDCCAHGRGVLVNSPSEWEAALSRMVEYPDERIEMVRRAQHTVTESYSKEQFVRELMALLRL